MVSPGAKSSPDWASHFTKLYPSRVAADPIAIVAPSLFCEWPFVVAPPLAL